MSSLFNENKRAFFLLLTVLFLAVIVFGYLILSPLIEREKATERELEQLNSDLAVLKATIENKEKQDTNDVPLSELTNQLPLDPNVHEIIVALEEIELNSESVLQNISFSYDGLMPERGIEQQVENEDDTAEEPVNTIPDKPDILQIITITMSVTSPSEEHFQQFLRGIENQDRIMVVNNVSFQNETDNDERGVTANIQLSTFYYHE